MQTFGDLIGHNPHCHILVTDGCFYGNKGMFRVASPLELKKLEAIFQHKVFRMFLAKGKITRELIAMLSSWRHSGFHVFCGNRISPNDETAMENLARYMSSTMRTLEETERNQILKILSETRWRIEGMDGAAAILGLNPSILRARMHKLGIVRPETKESG